MIPEHRPLTDQFARLCKEWHDAHDRYSPEWVEVNFRDAEAFVAELGDLSYIDHPGEPARISRLVDTESGAEIEVMYTFRQPRGVLTLSRMAQR